MVSDYYTKAKDLEPAYMAPEVVRQRMRTLGALALAAGETAVDVGCGPGFLTRDMALDVGTDGRVIGIDRSSDMLTNAAERCRGLDQIELKDGDIGDLPMDDRECDAVACVQILLYSADVAAAVAEVRRVLKPGGRIAIVETDWRSAILNSTDQATTTLVFKAWDDAVPSPNLPGKLGSILRANGFAAIRTEAVPILDTSPSNGNFSINSLDGLAQIAVERGMIGHEQKEAWLGDLHRRRQEGCHFFCVNRFLFSATRM